MHPLHAITTTPIAQTLAIRRPERPLQSGSTLSHGRQWLVMDTLERQKYHAFTADPQTAWRLDHIRINGRTLSGVTRRTHARIGSDAERRVTFDRAVWTKPLAFAADAAFQLCVFNREDHRGRACAGLWDV
jgi:hypothetical protein